MTIRSLTRFPRLRRLAWAVAAAIAALPAAAVPVRGEPAAASVYARGGGPPPVAAAETPAAQAERILVASLLALDRPQSVLVEFRQLARVGNRVLRGKGRYLQSGTGEDQRYRFESRFKADTESFETIEVCDGVTAWAYRKLGVDPAHIERMEVRPVRERLAQFGPPGDVSLSRHLGGLQRTLWTARQWFRFESATAAEIEGLPVWIVEGGWHADSLAAIEPTLKEACRRPGGVLPEELPDGMPWRIRFVIARGDLLPRCVEYLAIPGPRPAAGRETEPIARLELLEIRLGEPVDASEYIYRPAKEIVPSDVTDSYVGAMGPMRH